MPELTGARLTGMRAAASGLRRVASSLEHEGRDYGRHVLGPLRRGDDWSGAGQPEAKTVVEADALAIATAVGRLRHAATTLATFSTAVDDCRRTLSRYVAKTAGRPLRVGDDGTVTTGDGASSDDEDDAEAYTTRIKQQLRMASRIDALCAATLTRLTGKEADGQPGYALPVFSAYTGGDVLDRSRRAFAQRYTVGPVTSASFALSTHLWRATVAGDDRCHRLPAGGGFVVGPDMRLYPITAVTSYPQRAGAGGWHSVGSQVGTDVFDPPSRFDLERAQAAIGTAVGAPLPLSFADAKQTRQLQQQLALGGVPRLPDEGGSADRHPRRPGLGDDQRTQVRWSRSGQPQVVNAPTRAAPAAGAPQLLASAAQNAVIAQHLPDGYEYAYRTNYLQNERGQVRAVVERYQVSYAAGNRRLATQTAYLAESGRYVSVPLDDLPPTMYAPD